MPAYLHRLNLVLLLALGVLCAFQWNTGKIRAQSHRELAQSQSGLTHQLAEATDSLKAAREDLDAFRAQILALKTQGDEQAATLRKQSAQIGKLESSETSLTRQLEHWKQAVEQYGAAVKTRDEQIATLIQQRDQYYAANKAAIERANTAVAALNDLNQKYSEVVTLYNSLVAQTQAKTPPPAADAKGG
ncbi:MAG: hypothetical protein WDM96_06895 [Lacunisphaera sp.]